jgi:hypothetical protein
MVVDGTKLMRWKDDYKVALICGFVDLAMDRLEDDRITTSNTFSITPTDISMSAPFSPVMANLAREQGNNATRNAAGTKPGSAVIVELSLWNELVLLKRETLKSDIHKLADVSKNGGILFSPQ